MTTIDPHGAQRTTGAGIRSGVSAGLDLGVFSTDCAQARCKFLDAARRAGAELRAWPNPGRNPAGEALCTDTAWLGARDAARVLVVIAGTHGVEGFCGSGPQIGLLRGDSGLGLPAETAVLLIHGINRHGWAWLRRVTEENVDLNRDWVDFAQPLPENPGYAALHGHYLPESLEADALARADASIADWTAVHGAHAERVAGSSGQYTHPDGLFYGGTGPTWSRLTGEAILAEYLPRARAVAIVDMHTGLGPYAYGEPICNHAPGGDRVRRARAWWGDSVTEPPLGTSELPGEVGPDRVRLRALPGARRDRVRGDGVRHPPGRARAAGAARRPLAARTRIPLSPRSLLR